MEISVGDVVAWADVPDGALVRDDEDGCYALKRGGRGQWIYDASGSREWWPWQAGSARPWSDLLCEHTIIIALGLTGNETADDLRRLAEVFEVPEPRVYEVISWTTSVPVVRREGTITISGEPEGK